MTTAFSYAKENAERFRQELYDLLRIPSVSTDPAYAEDVRRAANWLVEHLREIGLETELIETENQHPMVYAEWMGAGADAKTVLIYGHYDVQPAEKSDGWDTDPFEPVEKDGVIYARGSTDDKGQMFAQVKAVESLLKSDDDVPVNIKLILEGEEEHGSHAINAYINAGGEKLKADVCVISDSSMIDPQQPIIINALRGMVALEVTVNGPKQDLHSGMFGGTIHNPVQALAEIIAQLHKPDGSVAVPGFYEHVRELSEEDRETIAQLTWDNIDWSEATGASVPWGEDGYSLRERVGARPTLEINGMGGGYFGDGFKAIVPAKAVAKISCRLVADQKPDDIAEKVKKFIAKITPPTVQIAVRYAGGASAALIDTEVPAMKAAIRAYEAGWGAKPLFKREGGSIPVVASFQNQLDMPVVMMGFGLDSDNLHGPNEHFSVEMFQKGIDTAIFFLREMAQLGE